MFDPDSTIVVGLEIGTAKVCAVVANLTGNDGLAIMGVGQASSRGVRKGEIVNADRAVEDIRAAIAEAEQMANVEIRSVYLGVTGGHIRGFNNRGRHNVVSDDGEITEADVRDVLRNAKAINLPADHHVIHVVRQHFLVQGQEGIVDPVGMLGAHLEVDVHVIHGMTNRLQNSIRAVKSLQLEVEDIVFTGVAASLAVLDTPDKELGALVIDLGAGVSNYVVYANGLIEHSGVLTVGGDHVTNDLAYGLKVSMNRAEELKLAYGAALVEDADKGRTVSLGATNGLPGTSVNLEHLRRIMSLRLEETFEIIAEEIEPTGLLDYLRAGVFLCGGGARVPGVEKLAARVFGLPVVVGRAKSIGGLASALDQPEFAAAIGLAKVGSFQTDRRKTKASLGSRLRATFNHIFQKV